MLVMHKGVSLEDAFERRSTHAQEVFSVHQLPMNLVLDKRHQNARENEPDTNLKDKHLRSLESAADSRQSNALRTKQSPLPAPVNVT
jgi:hypothetical protein